MSFDFSGPFSFDQPGDFSIEALRESVSGFATAFGRIVCPKNSLGTAVNESVTGDVIVLLPGRYKLANGLDIDKTVSVRGFGRVVLEGSGTMITLSGVESELQGVRVEHSSSETGADALIDVTGARACVRNCVIDGNFDDGINVTASGVCVQGCRFEDSSTHGGTGDSDIFWADGATNGQALGNMHSTTRQWVLDYRAVDNMSDAANGRSAIINVR